MKRILVINEGNSPNLGDQAINYCVESLFKDKDVDISFQPYSGESDIRLSSQKAPRNKIKNEKSIFFNLLKKLLPTREIYRLIWGYKQLGVLSKHKSKNYDLIVIGGGQLINKNRIFPFAIWYWTFIFATLLKKKIILLGVGHGEKLSGIDKFLVKSALGRFDDIYLRDRASIEKVKKEYNISADYIPDVVFGIADFFDDDLVREKEKIIFILPCSYKNVYLRYNDEYSYDEYLNFWITKINHWIDKEYTVKIGITDSGQDFSIYQDLKREVKENKSVIFKETKNLNELVEEIRTVEKVFSGRMHALIIGLSFGATCISYNISDKLLQFNKEIIDNNSIIPQLSSIIFSQVNEIKNKYITLKL